MSEHNDQTGAEVQPDDTARNSDVVDLEAPPAAPVELTDERERPSEEAGAAPAMPAPASSTDDDDDVDEELEAPARHESSAGFGTTAKFSGAREDREAQVTAQRERIAELEGRYIERGGQ